MFSKLPALPRYQFILASSWFYRHHQLTTSLLDPVVGSTSRSVTSLPLFLQPQALQSRLQTKYAGVTYLTRSPDLHSTTKIVIEALKSVTAFEKPFRTSAGEERADKIWTPPSNWSNRAGIWRVTSEIFTMWQRNKPARLKVTEMQQPSDLKWASDSSDLCPRYFNILAT